MPNPIKELAKLTCRAKQVDGTGFGGICSDNLEVAAILGLRNAVTGEKISDKAYRFARLVYCGDLTARAWVKASLLNVLLNTDTGRIKEDTLLRMVSAAIREYQSPCTKVSKDGVQVITTQSDTSLADSMGIKKQSLTDKHREIYNLLFDSMINWSNEVYQHIKSHYEENAA